MVILEFNNELLWQSDWSGDEVGYDNVSIVGLYSLKDTNVYFYIDMETNKILAAWGMKLNKINLLNKENI